ncbi:MAG: hypothetical protein IJB92_03330 [Clostridia bacterium]|nr:hypothetical protein [Clostridia bacterium]
MDSKLYESGIVMSADGKSIEFMGRSYAPKVEEIEISGSPMEYRDVKIPAPAFYRQGRSYDFEFTVRELTANLDSSDDYLEVIAVKDGETIIWTKYCVK